MNNETLQWKRPKELPPSEVTSGFQRVVGLLQEVVDKKREEVSAVSGGLHDFNK
jgi:hypothetical protein